MNPAKLILCLWAFLVSFNVFPQNCITTHPNDALECKGTFVATSEADINTYMVDLGLNSNTNKIKNLKIDFDYTGDINLFSACKLIIENNRNLSATGTACLVAKEEVRIESGASLTTVGDAKLYSANIVTLQANTNLDIGGTMEMVSTQATGEARVNIRNNTTINVGGDLYMRALRQAKVGHHANITVGETFTIISNGETLSEEDSDWSSISYDSVINARRLSIASYEKVNIGARTIVNTDSIYLNALDCKIQASSQINSASKEGNCFSGLHPEARFRTTPIGGGEAPLQLFINGDRSTTPSGNIVAYHWEFVGLGTVTTTIPTTYYTFNEPGTYRIRLQVENSDGLKNTTSRKIIVTGDANQAPNASFTTSSSDILIGESITVDASSSTDDYQIRKYRWNLSNGASLITRDPVANFTFSEAGSVDISLVVVDFFGVESEAFTQTINVEADTNGNPVNAYFNVDLFPTFTGLDIYNRSIAGDGEITELYYLVDGVRYDLYDFTYGSRINLQNITHDGDIEVSIFVTDSLGNQSSLTKTFIMNNTIKPIVSFDLEQSDSLTAYVKAIKSYDPLNDINSISIDWGDGVVESLNPTNLYLTHQYLQAGDYNVTLTINTDRGESSSLTKTISIIDGAVSSINPTALFEVQKDPALGHVRIYVSESGTPNGSITGYSWQMGDGNVIEGLDQVAYFYDVGVYPVTLTITDSLGLSSSQTQTIVITENGDPLVISPQCNTNSNTLTADCITYVAHRFAQFNNLQVDWGDGSVENFSPLNPYASIYDSLTHTYSEAGSYTATFYATAANGDTATVTREFYFDSGNMRPTGYLTCTTNGLTVFCNGTGSYDPDGFITHYEFEVAQGNVIFSQDGQLSFTYPQAGTYQISLVAYDQLGLDSIPVSTTVTLEQVNNPPVAQLNCNSDAAFKVSCDAIGSYDSDGGIYTYEYIFYGDTTESVIRNTDSSFNYYFASAGIKRIDLIVTDDKGVSATTTINVDVQDNVSPIAAFNCSSTVAGQVDCDGSNSSDSDGTIANYFWIIGGVSYQGQEVSASGINGENTTVQLRVVDNLGADNITSDNNVFVKQVYPPIAVASCVETDILTISCSGSGSSDPDNQALTYTWSFSDGGSKNGENVSYTFSTNSTNYSATLIVTDTDGASSSQSVSVNPAPAPAPTVAFSCYQSKNLTLTCSALGTEDSYGTIEEYFWNIDGSGHQGHNTIVEFSQAGTVSVNLMVTSSTGAVGNGIAKDFIITDDNSGVGNSDTIAELQDISFDSFNPIAQQLIINISDGSLALDSNGEAEFVEVELNEEVLSSDSIVTSSNSIEVNKALIDGLNRVVVSYKDDFGKNFTKYFEFIAGESTVNINIIDENNNSLITEKAFLVLEEYPSFIQSSNSGDFINVPKGNVKVVIVSDDSYYGAQTIQVSQNLESDTVQGFNLSQITQGSSLDFENGTTGFEVFEGVLNTQPHDNSSSIIDYEEGRDELVLGPNIDGNLIVGGNFYLQEETSLPLNINTNNINDDILIVVKNTDTNQIDLEFTNSRSLGYRAGNSLLSIGATTVTLPIGNSEVFIVSRFDNAIREDVSLFNYFSKKVFKNAHANNRLTSTALVMTPALYNEVYKKKLDKVGVSDINPGFGVKEPLYGVSFGKPRVLNGLDPFFVNGSNGEFQNIVEINIRFHTELGLNDELYFGVSAIGQKPTNYIKIDKYIRDEGVDSYRVDLSQFYLSEIGAELHVARKDIILGKIVEDIKISNIYGSAYFPVSEHYGDFLLPNTFSAQYRFGDINLLDGYATWVSPLYRNEFDKLKNTGIVLFNDFSSLNLRRRLRGSGTKKRGAGSHQYGNDTDIRVLGTDSDIQFNQTARRLETAKKLFDIGNLVVENLRKIGVTHLENSDFERFMQSKCMKDGRFAWKGGIGDGDNVGVFQKIDNFHFDHYHVSFYDPARLNLVGYRQQSLGDLGLDLGSYFIEKPLDEYIYTKGAVEISQGTADQIYESASNSTFQKLLIDDFRVGTDELYVRYGESVINSSGECTLNCINLVDISSEGWYRVFKKDGTLITDNNLAGLFRFDSGSLYVRKPLEAEKGVTLDFRIKRILSGNGDNGGHCVNKDSSLAITPLLSNLESIDTKGDTVFHLRDGVSPEVNIRVGQDPIVIASDTRSNVVDANSNLDRFDLIWNFYQFVSPSTIEQTIPDFVFESSTSGSFDYGKLPFTGENGVTGNNFIHMVVKIFDKHTGQSYDSQITQVRLSCLNFQIDKFCSCAVDANSTFTYSQNGGGDIQIDQVSGECVYPQAKLIETSNVLGGQGLCSTQEHFANKRYPSCISTYTCDQGFSATQNTEVINSSQVQNCNIISTDQNGVDTWGWEPLVESFSETVTCGGIDFLLTCNWNM